MMLSALNTAANTACTPNNWTHGKLLLNRLSLDRACQQGRLGSASQKAAAIEKRDPQTRQGTGRSGRLAFSSFYGARRKHDQVNRGGNMQLPQKLSAPQAWVTDLRCQAGLELGHYIIAQHDRRSVRRL
jgi:hypothetical protein